MDGETWVELLGIKYIPMFPWESIVLVPVLRSFSTNTPYPHLIFGNLVRGSECDL